MKKNWKDDVEQADFVPYQIEKGVPVPVRYAHGAFREIARKMEIGDSIVFHNKSAVHRLRYCLQLEGKLSCSRREIKEGVAVWRAWRIK